jgi:uncharacterized membrane protein
MPIGPVQLLVVSFDNRTSPEILAELNRLRENQVIRLIDALAVQKNLDGTLAALQWSDLPAGEAEGLGATVGALLGLGADGEAGMEAGAIAGMDAGSHGHLIDESEVGRRRRHRAWQRGAPRPDRTRLGRAAARQSRR